MSAYADDPHEIPFASRVAVADVADYLIDLGFTGTADKLLAAIRCCEHFPECSHMLAYAEWRAAVSGSKPDREQT